MDCRTFHKRLEDFLEDRLDFSGRFGVERHARQCYACDRDLSAALKLRRLARGMGRVSAPSDFEASIMARIQREKRRHGLPGLGRFRIYGLEAFSWRGLAYASGALALLATALLLLQPVWNQAGRGPVDSIAGGASPLAAPEGADGAPPADALPYSAIPAPGRQSVGATQLADFSGSSSADPDPAFQMTPVDSDYVEYLVPGGGDRQLIMRLPKTILMKYGQPSEEYFIRNVSH